MSKWPATILAVSRTHKVIGRIIVLVSSIRTMKFIKKDGVPWGTKWIRKLLVFTKIPNIRVLAQKHKAKKRVTVNCEVLAKFWGNKAKTFKNKMKNKIDKVNKEFPFLILILKSVSFFITLERVINSQLKFIFIFLEPAKNIMTRNTKKKEENLKYEEEGSNMENKLFIIFNIYDLWFSFLC